MRIFKCIKPLIVPCRDGQGRPVAGREITVAAGAAFTAEDTQSGPVQLEGLVSAGCLRLTVSRRTLVDHFVELTMA